MPPYFFIRIQKKYPFVHNTLYINQKFSSTFIISKDRVISPVPSFHFVSFL